MGEWEEGDEEGEDDGLDVDEEEADDDETEEELSCNVCSESEWIEDWSEGSADEREEEDEDAMKDEVNTTDSISCGLISISQTSSSGSISIHSNTFSSP